MIFHRSIFAVRQRSASNRSRSFRSLPDFEKARALRAAAWMFMRLRMIWYLMRAHDELLHVCNTPAV